MSDAYFLGATWAIMGLSGPTVVESPPYAVGGWLQQNGAGGTLWLGRGLSQIPGASGMMWINSGTVPFQWDGPARFYLYSTGSTMTVGLGFKFSSGMSQPVFG